jgi:hypothetical protein
MHPEAVSPMGRGSVLLGITVRPPAHISPTREAERVGDGASELLGGEGTTIGSCDGQRRVSMMTDEGLTAGVMPPSPEGVAHRSSGMGSPLSPSSHDYLPCSRPLASCVSLSSPP